MHYRRKISRIGLVLAISQYSKLNLDRKWSRPSVLVYPACDMVSARAKRNLVVTVGRAIPAKRLELFWKIASLCPEYEFAMLLTQDSGLVEYSKILSSGSPVNGRTIFNPPKEMYHRFLGEAKVYLHLMKGEHFGIAIVEAMSASCVPVVHDSGGLKEIVSGETGFRWQSIEDVPGMIEEAMKNSPSSVSRLRAEGFRFDRFEKKLSEIFSELHA
jgi:glycosyltransferase involved in cell wall biosynthesis